MILVGSLWLANLRPGTIFWALPPLMLLMHPLFHPFTYQFHPIPPSFNTNWGRMTNSCNVLAWMNGRWFCKAFTSAIRPNPCHGSMRGAWKLICLSGTCNPWLLKGAFTKLGKQKRIFCSGCTEFQESIPAAMVFLGWILKLILQSCHWLISLAVTAMLHACCMPVGQ